MSDSRRTTTIIHSRASSSDSRSSTTSRDSMEARYSTGTSTGGGRRSEASERIVERLRVPDNDRHYIEVTTTKKARIIHHDMGIRDPNAPRTSDARYEDYNRPQNRR